MSKRVPRPPVLAEVHNIANERFQPAVTDELSQGAPAGSSSDRYDDVVRAAHAAHARVRLAPTIGSTPTPHQVAEVALRIFRLHRYGSVRAARQLASDLGQTREAVTGASVDLQVIGRVLQESLDQSVALDVAEVERSRMPEIINAAKKQKIPSARGAVQT